MTDEYVKVKVTNIDYAIEEEDLLDGETIEEIKADLPKELTFDIRKEDWEDEDPDELISDCIGEETGWLVYGFDYDILGWFDYDAEPLDEDFNSGVREYSDMLFDMIEEGMVDAKQIAEDLIYWCSEDDIKHYMKVNDLMFEEDEDDEDTEEGWH